MLSISRVQVNVAGEAGRMIIVPHPKGGWGHSNHLVHAATGPSIVFQVQNLHGSCCKPSAEIPYLSLDVQVTWEIKWETSCQLSVNLYREQIGFLIASSTRS